MAARKINTDKSMNREQLIQLANEHTRTVQAWLSSCSPNIARIDFSNVTAQPQGCGFNFSISR